MAELKLLRNTNFKISRVSHGDLMFLDPDEQAQVLCDVLVTLTSEKVLHTFSEMTGADPDRVMQVAIGTNS